MKNVGTIVLNFCNTGIPACFFWQSFFKVKIGWNEAFDLFEKVDEDGHLRFVFVKIMEWLSFGS